MKLSVCIGLAGLASFGGGTVALGQVAAGCSSDYLYSGFRPGFSLGTAVGSQPGTIKAGDFNADGLIDLAVVLEDGNDTLSILLGQGDGTFGPAQTYDPPGNTIFDLLVSDLDADSRSDLVVATVTNGVQVYLADANGTLGSPSQTPAGLWAKLTAIDLDQDGHPDLVGGIFSSGLGVNVTYGNGDGTFQSQQTLVPGVGVKDIAFGDFDSDGRVDLALSQNGGTASVEIFLREEDGSFVLANTLLPPDNSDPLIEAADLNGDGLDDLVSRLETGRPLRVWLATGGGDFAAQVALPDSASPSSIQSFILTDLDGDGDIDIAAGARVPESVQYHANNGNGTFAPPVRGSVDGEIRDVTVADLDNQGQPDVIATIGLPNTPTDRIEVYLGSCFFFPVITQQPAPTLASAGGQAAISVVAGGAAPLAYQWRRNGSPILNTATIAGARSPTLTLSQITREQAGEYDVVVTNAFGESRSFPAVVAVTPTIHPCPADLNGDGDPNTFDLLELLRDIDAGCP